MFVGLKQIGVGDSMQEFLELRYAGEDKLFVPVERLDLVQKYSGATRPPIDRLGGASWERAKTKVKKAMRDMAEELLKLYAARKAVAGHAFSRRLALAAGVRGRVRVRADARSEVRDRRHQARHGIVDADGSPALRRRRLRQDRGRDARRVQGGDGRQAGRVLAPTTVLAFQHQKTLQRTLRRVSRCASTWSAGSARKAEQKADARRSRRRQGRHHRRHAPPAVEGRRSSAISACWSSTRSSASASRTRRRSSSCSKKVDVLTMSATPIPRTLNMSLVGIRDMSIIETPPKDRLSIQTNVVKFDQQVIGRAIRNELDARRPGVFRPQPRRVDLLDRQPDSAARARSARRRRPRPDGRGRRSSGRCSTSSRAKFDVLLATTIVENGLDIPNANTIIINRADRYGLSQLYQLRGRVGRSDRPAYAYLLIPPEDNLSPVAKKRLAAIKEFSDLGSGFRVAALDLEIRGAGNLLGGEQSGQIDTVGFEMYMKLLEQTVRELKGEELEDDVRATVNLRVDLRIDDVLRRRT